MNAALAWGTDRFVIGTLTGVSLVGVVTVPAALAAGAAATRRESLREAVPEFVRVFRRRFRASIGPGLIAAVLLASAVTSLIWATSATDGSERIFAYAICLEAALGAVTVAGLTAALLDMGDRPTARNVVILMTACPGSWLSVVSLFALAVAAAGLAPILALPVLGAIVSVISGVRVRFEGRIRRAAAVSA
ncbi:hypothetical protein [Clavibacter michiganensis]|nr:hypothetical protein [Clavibacter michiganensis]